VEKVQKVYNTRCSQAVTHPSTNRAQLNVYGHITLKTPVLVRSPKLSNVERVQKVYNTRCSQAVTHPSTNRAQRCLTSVIGREPVFSTKCLRPYHVENTGSRPITEVKQR
ncbi:hypothetical protein B566_EDAN018527, partial [Ephemera danica]